MLPEFARAVSRWQRPLIVVVVAGLAGLLSWHTHPQPLTSDLGPLTAGARAWMAGQEPYTTVGLGRLIYPFMAVMVTLPFALTPIPSPLFVTFGAALFAWAALTVPRARYLWFALPVLITTVRMSQWSMLMTGAAMLPTMGWLLTCKPNIGAALWVAYPSRVAFYGALSFSVASLVMYPTWPAAWIASVGTTTHVLPPVRYWGGPLLLLAWLRWRRPEARLLGALALVPHTMMPYEAVPLFLIPQSVEQAIVLSGLALVFQGVFAATPHGPVESFAVAGQWMVVLLYLPCLVMILRRPNEHERPSARTADEPEAGKRGMRNT